MKRLHLTMMAATAFLIAAPCDAHTPAEEAVATRICQTAKSSINKLADFTSTDCTPAKDGDGLSLLFVTLDPIFAAPKAKKGYLLVLVGAVGAALNDNPKAKIVNVNFMDKQLAQQKAVFTISAKDAARLQREIKADRLDLEQYYNGILASGKVAPIKK